jgi:hypothetical protein
MEIRKLNREIIKERFDIEFFDDNYRRSFMAIMKKVYDVNSVAYDLGLEEILVNWDDFVNNLKNGYQMSVYEFDCDLDSYREPIEQLTSSKELSKFEEQTKLNSIVDNIDNRFKTLTFEVDLPNKEFWWERRILLKASNEYFDTLRIDLTQYNIVRI